MRYWRRLSATLLRRSDSHFIQVPQQVGRILIHAVCTSTLEFLLPVPPGEEADAERPHAAGGEEIPDAVPDDNRRTDVHPKTGGSRQEQVRVGLGVFYLISRDDRHVGTYPEHLQRRTGPFEPSAGRDRPWHTHARQIGQKLLCSGKRANLCDLAGVGLGVMPLESCILLSGYSVAGLAQEGIHEETSAHPDPTVDSPYGELDPCLLQGFAPGQNVLVDAIHQRTVEIKQEGQRAHDR